jgi:hypothetical protein
MALPRLCGANTFATSLGQDPGNPQSLPGSCYKRRGRPPFCGSNPSCLLTSCFCARGRPRPYPRSRAIPVVSVFGWTVASAQVHYGHCRGYRCSPSHSVQPASVRPRHPIVGVCVTQRGPLVSFRAWLPSRGGRRAGQIHGLPTRFVALNASRVPSVATLVRHPSPIYEPSISIGPI